MAFGPFTLALAGYHPIGGLLSAAVPWLFCPAEFAYFKDKWRWISRLLLALPVLVILLFFEVSAHYRLFAIPIQAKLHLADLLGLFAPLVTVGRSITLVGFYQVPIAALIMGIVILLSKTTGKKLSAGTLVAERRLGVIIIFCLGTILAFCGPIFSISPIVWLSFPILCCSVLIGKGIQAFAGYDLVNNKWLLAISVIMVVLSVSAWFLRSFGSEMTAVMYIFGATAIATIFFMARAKLHLAVLRLAILGSAMAVDIFFSARFIVDKTF